MTPDALAALHADAFRESRGWGAAEFEALLASDHCFLVSDSSCFALGRVIAGEAELITLAVASKFQRCGKGRLMLDRYHEAARTRQATQAFLEVAADNVGAINLYLSDGYIQSALRKKYYSRANGEAVDALILTKAL